ncbi:MAG: Na+ dependent nucleoside transporter [Bacteroidetes bacterium]|nr:Na+ dependent nucleoside transporter [Bacteroidota bacterium]
MEIYDGGGFSFISLMRGLFGLVILIGLAWVFSSNRRAISWRIVGLGLLFQLIIAIAVLKVPFIKSFFELLGMMFIKILDFTKSGSEFVFGDLMDVESFGVIFAFQILPTIIFFSALTSILFYFGIIQKIVYILAWLLTKGLRISGAESLSTAGNIFLGMTESPLLIKEYLEKMNRSEMFLVMVGGMATIAGSVLGIYIGILGGAEYEGQLMFAKHLITASVMAAPGAVVIAKILLPQTEPITSGISISREQVGANVLESIANGTTQGIKLAVNVGAMLIVFIALVFMVNFILFKIGDWTTLNEGIAVLTQNRYEGLSLQFIMGYTMAPLTWAMGVPAQDIATVGQLMGEKIIMNEMVAYFSFGDLLAAGTFQDSKSVIMATYMLCGFANISSIGIIIGGIGALAPGKRVLLSQLGFKALLGGAMASLLSATLVGMILG